MHYSKWARACLLCVTSNSTTQLPIKDQVKLTEAFCELYEIDTQLDEVWNTVQLAFYCPSCRAELLFIHEFQTLRQSGAGAGAGVGAGGQENIKASIAKLRPRLKSIQLHQETALQKSIDTLISSSTESGTGTGTGTGNPEDEANHDQIWEEIMKRKQLLICIELLHDLGPASSPEPGPEPDPEPEPGPEKDYPVPKDTDSLRLQYPSQVPSNLNPPPPSAPISTQEQTFLNKNHQDIDIEDTATKSVVADADADAVNAPNSVQNSYPDSIWKDIPDEGQDACYPADQDDHISNSEWDLDADVNVDVKPEIPEDFDFDPLADSVMKIIAVESLNNQINSDDAHFRLPPKSATADTNTGAELDEENNVLKEWKRRFNLKEFSINIQRIHFPGQETDKEAGAETGSETGSVMKSELRLNPKPNEIQDLYSSLRKSVATKKRELAESASAASALSKSTSSSTSKSELKSKSAIPTASNEEAEVVEFESALADPGVDVTLPCTWTGCANEFKTEKERVEHVRRIHEGFKKPFPCEICGKFTHSYNRYLDHQNLHLGLTPYECLMPGCKRSFHTFDQRREHLRGAQHTAERRIQKKLDVTSSRSIENPPREIPDNFAELKRLYNLKEFSIRLRNMNIKPDADAEADAENPTPMKEKELRTRSGRLVKKSLKAQEVIIVGDMDNSAVNLATDSESESDPDIIQVKMDTLRNKIRRRKQFNSEKRAKKSLKIKFDHQRQQRHHSKSGTRPPFTFKNICKTCTRVFPSARILADHQNYHLNLTPYHCPEPDCPYETAMERNLLVHSRVHQLPQFRCEETDCGRYFRERKCYKAHMASHKLDADTGTKAKRKQGTPRLTVPTTETETETVTDYENEAGDFKCDHCPNKTFTVRANYTRHMVTHSEDYVRLNLTCHSCSKVLPDKETFDQHEQDFHPEKCIFKCDGVNCKFSTPRATKLRWHVASAHPTPNPNPPASGPRQTQFKCPIDNCPYFSRTAGSLKGHMARRHTDGATRFECKFCRRKFKTLDYLKAHIGFVHSGTKEHVCKECGRAFSHKRYLATHEERHKWVNSITCDLCGLGFSAPSILFKHQQKCRLDQDPDPDPNPDLDNGSNNDSDRKTKSPKSAKYMCDICSRVFASARSLANHQKTHKNLTPYHCPEPDGPFKTTMERKLEVHRLVHKLPKFKCKETDCGKYFRGRKSFREHMASHKAVRNSTKTKRETPRKKVPRPAPAPGTVTKFKCQTCGRCYRSKTQLNRHVRNIHVHKMRRKEAREFKCDLCPKTFTVQRSYARHILTHDPEYVRDNLTCHSCSKVFKHKETFDHHEQDFHPEKCTFKCDQVNCKFSTPSETKLKRHVTLVHLNLNPRTRTGPLKGPRKPQFNCPVDNCLHVSRRAGALKIHLARRHPDATPFECSFCERKFKTLDYLKTHIKFVHAPTKDHVCSECGKAFATRRYLTNHQESHKEAKSFICDVCGLGFSLGSGLFKHKRRYHLKSETNSDPNSKTDAAQSSETPATSQKRNKDSYPCKFCGQIFTKERFLALHKRQEHAEKYKFQCDQCTFGSPRLIPLQKHITAKHTVGRPFKCHVCGTGFNNPKFLVEHMKHVHPPELNFLCTTCGKKFGNRRYLEDHQLFKHSQVKAKRNPPGRPGRGQAGEENSPAEDESASRNENHNENQPDAKSDNTNVGSSNDPSNSNSNSHGVKPPKNKIKAEAPAGRSRSPSLRKRKSKQVDKNQEPQLLAQKVDCEKPDANLRIETMELVNLETCEIFAPSKETLPAAEIQNPHLPQNILNGPDSEEFINFGFQYNYV